MFTVVLNSNEKYGSRAWCYSESLLAGRYGSVYDQGTHLNHDVFADAFACVISPNATTSESLLKLLELDLFNWSYAETVARLLFRAVMKYKMDYIFNPLLCGYTRNSSILLAAGPPTTVLQSLGLLLDPEYVTFEDFMKLKPSSNITADLANKRLPYVHLFFLPGGSWRQMF
jgi:hypothetical protein